MGWLDWVTALMVSAGGFFVFVGGVGAVRMPDLYTRMHATSLTDTLGSLLILAGLMLQSGVSLITLKIALVAAFLMVTGPTASYALANAAFLGGQLPEGCDDSGAEPGESQS